MATMKTVLIVGKGPTAKQIPADDPRIICALNGAARLCSRVDWLFVNDVSALKELSPAIMARTENVVIPSELHLDTSGEQTLPFDKLPEWFTCKPSVHIYQLDSAKKKRADIPYFGMIVSVGETAVAWMLHQGHRDFETIGINSIGGYHPAFANGNQDLSKPPDWFLMNWERMVERVESFGGTIKRVGK